MCDIVSDSFAKSAAVMDVDVSESLVDVMGDIDGHKSLVVDEEAADVVTVFESGEGVLSVVRQAFIISGMDVVIGYSIDSVPICCIDIAEELVVSAATVNESVGAGEELELAELLLCDDDIMLAIPLDSIGDAVEVGEIDDPLDTESGDDRLDDSGSLADVGDRSAELLRLELLALSNHAPILDVIGEEPDELERVVDEVAVLEDDDDECKSVAEVARSVLPEWTSVSDDCEVDAEAGLVVDASENGQL
ncbi:hypothetical protein IWW38_002750 [Coemansia aciculifera]|uniref:Uncharacterized protein n=1 Tax=Coemansia aciculifera TaxID=417176 RepID=A0ACC1M325_9FUNG|nr:hypothetical protein IWW38_002750 [Coemansia aciculifera]